MLNTTTMPSPDVGNIYTGAISHNTRVMATVFNPDASPDVLISWAYGQLSILRDMAQLVVDGDSDDPRYEFACSVQALVGPARGALEYAVKVGRQREACLEVKIDQAMRQAERNATPPAAEGEAA